jgi:TolB-like protein
MIVTVELADTRDGGVVWGERYPSAGRRGEVEGIVVIGQTW